MKFQALKHDFLAYLEKILQSSGDNAQLAKLRNGEISIFMYADEFKEYLNEKTDNASIFSKSLSEVLSMDFSSDQFISNDSTAETDALISDTDNLFIGLVNELLGQDEVKNIIDTDKSNNIDNSEITKFLSSISSYDGDDNMLSFNDILSAGQDINDKSFFTKDYSLDFLNDINMEFSKEHMSVIGKLFDEDSDGVLSDTEKNKAIEFLSTLDNNEGLSNNDLNILTEYINIFSKMGLSPEDIVKEIKGLDGNKEKLTTDDFNILAELLSSKQEAAQEGIYPNSVMESSGSGSITGGSRGQYAPAVTQKNVNNMSIEDLEKESESAKANVEKSRESYLSYLKEIDSELAEKMENTQTNIENTKSEIDTANNKLVEYTQVLNDNKEKLQNAQNRVSEIDGSIAELRSLLNDPEVDKGNIRAQITELENEKNTLNNETIPGLEETITETEEKINKLNNEIIPQLESELAEYETEYAGYEQEAANLAISNPDLQTALEDYNNAIEYQNKVEQVLQLRKADREREENSDRPALDEAPKDYRGSNGYDFDNMPMTYTLDGEEYHCIGFEGYDLDGNGEIDFKPDSWEEVQRYFANGGVANIGKFGSMQCHNYSDILGQFVLGDANMEFVQALYNETNDNTYGDVDTAGKLATQREWNPRRFAQCKASDRDAERAIIENELQNGRPALVSVPTSQGQHWAVAVGISDDGDILIWDSYNGSMKKLGRSSNNDKNDLHRNLATGNGVMVYCQNYSYSYSGSAYIDYWNYVENSPQYVLENGYR